MPGIDNPPKKVKNKANGGKFFIDDDKEWTGGTEVFEFLYAGEGTCFIHPSNDYYEMEDESVLHINNGFIVNDPPEGE